MKLRVRLNKQTSRLELDGEDPTLSELRICVRDQLLPSWGLSPEAEFGLSLNGRESLCDMEQTLSSCGIVSGDLICVILHQPDLVTSPDPPVSHAVPPERESHGANAASSNAPSTSGNEADMKETGSHQEAEPDNSQGAGPFTPAPMLCSETENGEVPHALEVLYHRAECMSPCDSLVVSAHLLMMETGFVPQETVARNQEDAEAGPGGMPLRWRAAGGVYRLTYTHPLCERCVTVLLAVPMANMLVFNATQKVNDAMGNARKLSLKPTCYVTEEWQGEDPAAVYKDLKKLSRIFKDQVAYPLIAAARQAMNLPAVFGLTVLPPELLLRILRLLDVGSVACLSGTCRDLHSATADPSLWRHLYHRDFRDQVTRPRDTDWKELYKRKHRQAREWARCRRTRLYPVVPPCRPAPIHPFPFGPHPPILPPGIIGGEYDERPGIPHGILPRPRFDPLGPHLEPNPIIRGPIGRRFQGPTGNRSSDIRRGFI